MPMTITVKIVNSKQHVNIAHTVHREILKKGHVSKGFTSLDFHPLAPYEPSLPF